MPGSDSCDDACPSSDGDARSMGDGSSTAANVPSNIPSNIPLNIPSDIPSPPRLFRTETPSLVAERPKEDSLGQHH